MAGEHAAFRTRELQFHRYAYLFVDSVNVAVRVGEDPKLCLLVVIGVPEDGEKGCSRSRTATARARTPGARCSVIRATAGMDEPKLVTGDGALGGWGRARNVFPATREQRCSVHKTANCLDVLPKRLRPRAKSLLHEMAEAPRRGRTLARRWSASGTKVTDDANTMTDETVSA